MQEKLRNGKGPPGPCCEVKAPFPPLPLSGKLLLIPVVSLLRWNTDPHSSAPCVASQKVSHCLTWQGSPTNRNVWALCFLFFFWRVAREHKFSTVPLFSTGPRDKQLSHGQATVSGDALPASPWRASILDLWACWPVYPWLWVRYPGRICDAEGGEMAVCSALILSDLSLSFQRATSLLWR